MSNAPFNMLGKAAPAFSGEPEQPTAHTPANPKPVVVNSEPITENPRQVRFSETMPCRRGYGEYNMRATIYDDGTLGLAMDRYDSKETLLTPPSANRFMRFWRDGVNWSEFREGDMTSAWTCADDGRKCLYVMLNPTIRDTPRVLMLETTAMRVYNRLSPYWTEIQNRVQASIMAR